MRKDDNSEMNPDQNPPSENLSAPRPPARSIVGRVLLHGVFLLTTVVAFAAYEHFKLHEESAQSLASLLAAAGFGLAPLRALVRELLAIEGKMLPAVHAGGGLALSGLALGGVISGGPLLTHAALAPFTIMGAAQAVMHQDHPRSPEQAEALRRFATSLPEVEQFTKSGELTSAAASALPELRTRLAAARKTLEGK